MKLITFFKKLNMKSSLLKLALLFIATSCICGMCSKDDAGSGGGTNQEPALKPDATWLYFDDVPSLIYFHQENKRPQSEKWMATQTGAGFVSLVDSVNKKYLMLWSFENTGNTRFVSDALNPKGRESFTIAIKDFPPVPWPGVYNMDIDFKKGLCWYSVYNSSGGLYDSTRYQGLQSSTLNITKMTYLQPMGTKVQRYKMSGDATFHVFYWQSGTSSTSDIHTIQCYFNNVPIDFPK